MSTDTDVTGPHISSYMSLEQAMGEVRSYLENKRRQEGMRADLANLSAGQLSLQNAFIARLANISTRLGQVEPNSKLGAPGVFLKRVVRKVIGWYSRPSDEFDRTTLETFRQIRNDMLCMQEQIASLNRRVAEGQTTTPAFTLPAQSAPSQEQALLSMLSLFKGLIGTPAVRHVLENENPALLTKVDGLLETVEAEHAGELPIAKENAPFDRG